MAASSSKLNFDEKTFEFSLISKIALIQINKKRNCSYSYLKPLQAKCLRSALEQDTLAVLPTGFGKSLIFEMLPLMARMMRKKKTVTVICTPLNSIIEEQLSRYGDKAVQVKPGAAKDHGFVSAEYTYAIGHPEHLVAERTFRNDKWQDRVSHIVIDEAHCIVQWGKDFRKDFLELPRLRSMFPFAKVLGLTATATVKTREDICKAMLMRDVTVVAASIDRPNLKYSVKKRPPITGGRNTAEASFAFCVDTLFEDLQEKKAEFKKTIVYVNSLKYCGAGYESCLRCVGKSSNDLVTQYHAACTEEMKKKIVKAMAAPDGPKLLFATEAYSMGTDAPDIRLVVHIGPPSSLETYVQEVGRAGRDGEKCEAILYYNNSDIAKNKPGMTDTVQQYCRLESCRRDYLCQHFGFELERPVDVKHLCCDVCEQLCTCNECEVEGIIDVDTVDLDVSQQASENSVLRDLLQQYFSQEDHHSLNDDLLDFIVQCGGLCDLEAIIKGFPTLDEFYVMNILKICEFAQTSPTVPKL